MSALSYQSGNRLLSSLSKADFGLLLPDLEAVSLDLKKVLERPNKRIEDVYFPDAGFASVVAVQPKQTKVEVGLIGREGMTGLPVVLGNHKTPHETYIQAAGHGQRINATKLRKAMAASSSLQSLLLKFVQAFMVQTAQTAISNARAKLNERLARWILMADDRIDGSRLPLTHEFLSLMLGVRRAGCNPVQSPRSQDRASWRASKHSLTLQLVGFREVASISLLTNHVISASAVATAR